MPVVVNTVLNEHRLVLDIVAFVQKGDFPRSRLGEKQRGKILASWVSRKMRTIAQFSIRDPDAEGSVGTAVPDEVIARRSSMQSGRANTGAFRGGPGSFGRTPGTAGSSLRNVESIPRLSVAEEPLNESLTLQTSYASYHDGSLAPPHFMDDHAHDREGRNDSTPTNERPMPLQLNTTLDYSPVGGHVMYESPNPTSSGAHSGNGRPGESYSTPNDTYGSGDYLSYQPASPIEIPMGGRGGLRVANRTSVESEEWSQEAMRHLNLRDQ